MPKVLSLKKAQQTCPPKNQKSITHFFKNNTGDNSKKSQDFLIKSSSLVKSTDNQLAKRKASSPILQDSIEILDEPYLSSSAKNSVIYSNSTPKKHKTLSQDHSSPIKNSQKNSLNRQSPKRNGCDGHKTLHDVQIHHTPDKKSPKKENRSVLNDVNTLHGPEKVFDDDLEISDRLPFTPVPTDNIIENHDLSKNYLKSSYIENKNHERTCVKTFGTPVKKSPHKNHNNFEKKNRTPKKSPIQVSHCSPVPKLATPDKNLKNVISPSKYGSTVKALDFNVHDICDEFGDEWEVDEIDEKQNSVEVLDLTTMQRCEVVTVKSHGTRLELILKNASNNWGNCFVEGFWLDTPLTPGDIVSVLAHRDSSGCFCIGNTSGLLVLRPDHLISSTSVVAGVFCKRKAVMQERWRGIDSPNTAMTIGILIHELVQKALTQNIMTVTQLRSETDSIIKESVQMLYDAGLSEEEARSNMQTYIAPLAEFMQKYVADSPVVMTGQKDKDNWCGHIDKVLDIEENLCCPQLGLKGKIDATLQVTIHDRKGHQKLIVPLELKSGKASVSAEHRGQLVLYGMMLSLLRNEDPTQTVQRGLLLYLRDRVDLREVSCGYPERRDLVMLRNQLVQYLAQGPQDVDPEQLVDIEDASALLQQKLPEPVHHETACAKCPYLTLCSLHLWHTDGPSVSESHPLSKLREQALGHLSPDHIKYFLHWTALLKMEERGQMATSPLHALWIDSVEKRSHRGTCAANLKLMAVKPSGDRYLHVFERQANENENFENNKSTKGPQEGEFSIVSIENRPWIAAGVVLVAKHKEIHILLERDLRHRLDKNILFTIDTYESYATTVQNLTNLGVLIEDSDRADRLRKLIIDKTTPEFDKKLPREVGRLGSKVMRSLNIQQQRAVLKALAAKHYALLQGLPGTGKTQTISVLIQMLVGLKQRVLVTAHTHSAVDTVLSRLPDSMKVMRLGSSARVSPSLQNCTEQSLAAACNNPEQLGVLYDSMEVVGVTCLGATHAMLARTVFDVCIVDEATQVLQTTVLRPLFSAKRFVLVGDPEQLPPVVRSRAARRLGMEESLFHRLITDDATSTLQLQYRMNQALVDIANRVAYNDRLKCADEKVAHARLDIDTQKISHLSATWLQAACSPEPHHAALFLDMQSVDGTEKCNNKSCTNDDEACVVHAIVDALIQGGVKSSDIGIIAPFRDQMSLLRRSLAHNGVDVSTVDQFQGRDKSVIIYSCTKRNDMQDDKKVKDGEVLNDQRRLAVSVTRAKHKLLIVGNSYALHRYTPLQRLINACATLQLDKSVINSVRLKYRTLIGTI